MSDLLLTDEEIKHIWHNQSWELATETVADAARRVAKAQHNKILDELKRIIIYSADDNNAIAVDLKALIARMEVEK